MSEGEALERARARMVRWRILRILDAGRPYPVGEGLVAGILADLDLQPTPHDIRKALRYLADKGFVELNAPRDAHWEARLLPTGVDYLEGNLPEDPGITRPARR